MFLQKIKPNSNGQRWVYKYNNLILNPFLKLTKFYVKSKSGRNLTGRITVRHRQNPYPTFFIKYSSYNFFSKLLLIIAFKNIYKNRLNIVEVLDKFGNIYHCNNTAGLFIGDYLKVFPNIIDWEFGDYLGSKMVVTKVISGQIFSNLVGFFSKKKISTSPGTYCNFLSHDYEFNMIKISLPSGQVKFINSNHSCTIGRVSNEKHNTEVLGRAGTYRSYGFRSSVRGVAMNPVDHPHGGRTKTNSPERSPWGWVTKNSR